MCVRPTWVKFCSLVSQFVKVALIFLSCAELNSALEPHLPAQVPVSPTSRLSWLTPPLSCSLDFSSAHPPKKAPLHVPVELVIPIFDEAGVCWTALLVCLKH